MKLKRLLFIVAIIFILILIFDGNVFAENNNDFKFEKSNYLLRGEHADEAIDFVLPDGYTIKDVEITSENENIVSIIEVNDWDLNIYHRFFMESLSVGETRLKATIKSTNYVAYCNVKVEESIIINVSKNGKYPGATLEIDSCCNLFWLDGYKQACEISVKPLNSGKEEKWIRLGEEGIFGEALNKKYGYAIDNNCVVTVRWVSWGDGIFFNGEHEIYRKTLVIDDLEPADYIDAFIKIYANKYDETYSNMNVGDKLKLNTEIVEISPDIHITWKSYQDNVAIVDSYGQVTAIREGTARIEATGTYIIPSGGVSTYKDVYTVIVGNNKVDVQQTLETNGAVSGIIPNEVPVGSSERALIHGDDFNVTWSSTDDKIATVSKDGLIKGISNGNVTINANIDYNNKTYKIAQEVKVSGGKTKEEESLKGIKFFYSEPEPANIINKEIGFELGLTNIPDTEKANIKFSVDNENIAKITDIDLCNGEDGNRKESVIAKVKFLALGKTKLNATLDYNGKTYTDSYVIDVIESAYSLILSANKNKDLPSSLEVGNKIQLTAMLHTYGGSLIPRDVTSDGVTWTSSNDKIIKVDSKGLVTAVGEGNATITAKYKIGDETILAKYELKITDSTKKQVNNATTEPGKTDGPSAKGDPTTAKNIIPQTGESTTIIIIATILVASTSIIMYKKYKNYKDIK